MNSTPEILQDETGITSVEYVVILIFVCVLGITGWVQWRQAVRSDAAAHYTAFGYSP